jgi:hypothetical protein
MSIGILAQAFPSPGQVGVQFVTNLPTGTTTFPGPEALSFHADTIYATKPWRTARARGGWCEAPCAPGGGAIGAAATIVARGAPAAQSRCTSESRDRPSSAAVLPGRDRATGRETRARECHTMPRSSGVAPGKTLSRSAADRPHMRAKSPPKRSRTSVSTGYSRSCESAARSTFT